MNRKFSATILVTGLLTFLLGRSFHDIQQFVVGLEDGNKQIDNVKVTSSVNHNENNSATKLSGRFVMKDANCSGFNFMSPSFVTWTNETDCPHPDTLKIRWLDNTTFFIQDIVRLNENCPPRVWIYQVVSYDGIHLNLKDIWTGWNEHSDERIEFIKREVEN